jgi:hypothetical protein
MENQGVRFNLNLNHVVYVLVFAFISASYFNGCSSTPKGVKVARQAVLEAYELQKPIMVQTSKGDKRPAWTKKTVYEENGNVYFSGGFLNGSDYSVTVRCANAEALKVATQSISQFIRAEFSEYVQGSNTGGGGVDRYVEDGIATFVDNLHVQGVRQAEVYYEEVFSASVMQPTFNIWVRLEIGKADYLKAKADILRKLRDRFSEAGESEAKEKAERLLEDLKRG